MPRSSTPRSPARKPAPAPVLTPADPERLRVLLADTHRIVAQADTFARETANRASCLDVLLPKYASVPHDVEDPTERLVYADARALSCSVTAAVSYAGSARIALIEAVEAARLARPGACAAVEALRAQASQSATQAGLVAAHAAELARSVEDIVVTVFGAARYVAAGGAS